MLGLVALQIVMRANRLLEIGRHHQARSVRAWATDEQHQASSRVGIRALRVPNNRTNAHTRANTGKRHEQHQAGGMSRTNASPTYTQQTDRNRERHSRASQWSVLGLWRARISLQLADDGLERQVALAERNQEATHTTSVTNVLSISRELRHSDTKQHTAYRRPLHRQRRQRADWTEGAPIQERQ